VGLVTDNGDGTFTYDPNGAFENLAVGETATDSFTYTVSDGNGGTDTATVTVTIDGANDTPTANDDAAVTDEETVINIPASGVLANDSDPDTSDSPTVGEVNGSAASVGATLTLASGAQVTLNADGSYNYDPNGAFNFLSAGDTATDSFAYTIEDGNGGTDTAAVTVTINGVNDAPTANDDTANTDEDSILNVPAAGVVGNDVDPDSSDSLTVSEVNGNPADVGTPILLASGAILQLNADGSYDYDPSGAFNYLAAGESATDSFTYKVNDGNGGTDTAAITVTIDGVNDDPTANPDAYGVNEDTVLVVGAAGVLANDSDPDTTDTLSILLASGPANGAVTLNADGSFSYTPDADFNGIDSFTYQAGDGTSASNVETVTITVAPVNDAPVAGDTSYSVTNTDTLDVTAPGVLVAATDVDGDPLTAIFVTLPANGTLVSLPDGSFQYVPNAGFDGTDTFTYRADDGSTLSNTATATIDVTAFAGPPDTDPGPDPEPEPDPDPTPEPPPIDDPGPGPEEVNGSGLTTGTFDRTVDDRVLGSPSPLELDYALAGLEVSTDYLSDPVFRSYFDPTEENKNYRAIAAVDNVVFDTGLLWNELDFLNDELSTQFEVQWFIAGSAKVVTLVLATGFVVWAVKGGYLLAFMISAMPAWRLIDPLPVLSNWRREEQRPAGQKDEKIDLWEEYF
jgi:VCBS repeat-containing protein